MTDNHNFDDDSEYFDDEYVPTINRWKLVGAGLALVIVAGFGIGIWYAYDQGVKKGVKLAPPIIKADTAPVKKEPDEPGGMEIPHQDKQVFNVLDPEKKEEKVEKLMAPPEKVVEEPKPVDVTEDEAPKKPAEPETLMAKEEEKIAEKVEEVTEKVEEAAEKVAVEAEKKVEAAEEKAVETVAKSAEAMKAEKPVPQPEKKVAALPKEPVKKPEVAAKKPDVKKPAKASENPSAVFRVQLAAFRSEDAAKKAWGDLQRKHEALLSKEPYKIVSVEIKGKGMFHRLQAGAFLEKEDAVQLCNNLKAAKQDCLIARN